MLDNLIEEINNFTPGLGRNNKDIGKDLKIVDSFDKFDTKISSWRLSVPSQRWNILLVLMVTIGFFVMFLLRAVNIQILKRQEYLSLAENNRIRRITVLPERGVIYSSDGQVIARNQPAFGIQLNTQLCSKDLKDLSDCKSTIDKVGKLIEKELDTKRIFSEIEERKPVIIVLDGLEKNEILPVDAQIKNLPGIVVAIQPVREYVYGDSFAHVIGYIGLDEENNVPRYVGKSGIEQFYDDSLSGIPGIQIAQIDSTGGFFKVVSEQDALPGKNIDTFLNAELQNKAYELLRKKIEEGEPDPETGFKAEAGAIVAQDPMTGGILTLVSYPSFNPNLLVKGISVEEFNKLMSDTRYPFYNRAIGAGYPPGSTFKMVVASAALTEGVVDKNTTIFDPGYIQVGSYIFRNWNLGGHGEVNMERAIQVSNDTYFYTVGGGYGGVEGVGIDKLHDWAVKFGFGSKTGIDIEGETQGYMPDGSGEWYLGNTYITSIGQGDVLATPLQVNNMVSYFANGGFLMEPKIVESIDGVGEYENIILAQNLISKENYELIRSGMKKVTKSGGTAYPLFDFHIRHPGIELGGKTGTSEYIDSKGNDRTHALFSVFGPFDNPNIVLTVFLEGGGGGSDDAAPLAKELLDLWFE